MNKRRARAASDNRATFYGELKAIAQANNYSPRWADVNFREVHGEWPGKLAGCEGAKAFSRNPGMARGEKGRIQTALL